MAKAAPETILLIGEPNRRERDAAAAITPGNLIELTSSDTVQNHSTAGGRVGPRYVCVENDIAGDDIDDAYAAGEVVQFHSARPGDVLLMRLNDGENVVIGDFLQSAGNGLLRRTDGDSSAFDAEATSIIAVALEAKDMSDSSAADPSDRLRVEIV